MESLVPWLDKNWKLRELVLTRVACVQGFYVHLQTEELKKVTIRQCYQLQEPAIVGPNLESLVIEHCMLTKFHENTCLPGLTMLSVSSRNLKALQTRHLIKNVLTGSPALEMLRLAGCSQLEQLLVDPGDLPALRNLDLSSCVKLTRVHISSKMLESLDLSRDDALQYILLDLESVVNLDLSFLKHLTHFEQFKAFVMGNTTSWLTQSLCPEEQVLWIAAKSGDLTTLREGLARLTPETRFYAEWRDPVYGYSPLANACFQGHIHCVQALLSAGVNYNICDAQGNTPLHIATSCGKSEVVRLLLDSPGVDAFAKTVSKAQTALDIARD
ncbi:hypothetical protein BBJ29_006024 [Phytophthora kernoviae]|uniref:At1g61320/AtMIF1 LRR domain-containing protein n=1 Tax=Phytophthora kernoviae TaxID=325452 RepID=A0A3F2RYN5_9STRA|nr:hypothetical protein BBJ29_006024 [Phytophthora kernoviae]RLN65989.1 hypothetical protein BBP00_00002513 [Phytophthora kernoviae]